MAGEHDAVDVMVVWTWVNFGMMIEMVLVGVVVVVCVFDGVIVIVFVVLFAGLVTVTWKIIINCGKDDGRTTRYLRRKVCICLSRSYRIGHSIG